MAIQQRYLGGEMELNPDALWEAKAATSAWPFPAGLTVASGRTALQLILQGLKAHAHDLTALLPAYLCPTILQPFMAEAVPVRFYRVRADLSIDLDDLSAAIPVGRPFVLLFINYFGFPHSPLALRTLEALRGQGWTIEDCVPGSWVESAQPAVGQTGDFVITSFRKYLPVPDGGLILNRTGIPLPQVAPVQTTFSTHRLLAKLLRHTFLLDPALTELEDAFLALFSSAEADLDRTIPLVGMSPVAEKLLAELDLEESAARRRSNFARLARAFRDDARLRSVGEPLWFDLPVGVSPLVFPIRVADGRRDELRQKLAVRRAFCPVQWRLPPEVRGLEFEDAHLLSGQILGLPIDQRYGEQDMEALLARVKAAWGENQ